MPKTDRLRYVRWIWAPVPMPLWWVIVMAVSTVAWFTETQTYAGFVAGLMGGDDRAED